MKRKVKRFNGESDSVVEAIRADAEEARRKIEDRIAAREGDTSAQFRLPIKSTDDAKHETAAAPKTFKAAFAEARAKALKGGPKTFEWQGTTYGTALKGEGKTAPKSRTSPVIDAGVDAGKASEGRTTPEFKRQGAFPEEAAANRMTRLTGIATEEGRTGKAQDYERQRRQAAEERKATAAQTRSAGKTDTSTLRRNKMDAYVPVDEQSIYSRFKKGGKVKSASSRADGCAMRGKTRGMLR